VLSNRPKNERIGRWYTVFDESKCHPLRAQYLSSADAMARK
jgi:hypothetical protein